MFFPMAGDNKADTKKKPNQQTDSVNLEYPTSEPIPIQLKQNQTGNNQGASFTPQDDKTFIVGRPPGISRRK